jgi:uncharacterized membrane protein (UPF0136 family)
MYVVYVSEVFTDRLGLTCLSGYAMWYGEHLTGQLTKPAQRKGTLYKDTRVSVNLVSFSHFTRVKNRKFNPSNLTGVKHGSRYCIHTGVGTGVGTNRSVRTYRRR